MTELSRVLVQGSSRSWSGEKEESLEKFAENTKFELTISRLLDRFNPEDIQVICPAYDESGLFNEILAGINRKIPKAIYAFDQSPLLRMNMAVEDLLESDYILRINAQNCCFDYRNLDDAIEALASSDTIEIVKFPDDFISQLTFDIYRVSAIRKLAKVIPAESPFHIHPKHYPGLIRIDTKKHLYYTNEEMWEFRSKLSNSTNDFRTVTELQVPVGNQLSFHYHLTLPYIKSGDKILDLACGQGYGTKIIAEHIHTKFGSANQMKIIGADLIDSTLQLAESQNSHEQIQWKILDAQNINLPDGSIDLFTCFETLEHVQNLDLTLSEFSRILSAGGTGFFSTPQNAFGGIPLNYWHDIEYSYDEIRMAIEKHFQIEEFIGIKQGTIFFLDDPIGANSFVRVSSKNKKV